MKHLQVKNLTLFVAIILVTSCSKKAEDLKQPNLNAIKTDKISLILIRDSIIADGFTKAEFLLKVDSNIVKNYQGVVFSLSPIGLFSNDSTTLHTTLDANGEVRVFVKSSAKGFAIVVANLTNLCSKSSSVNFTTSFPEQILMQPAINTMASNLVSNASITAKLWRANGSVSSGMLVSFYDSTTTNKSIGVFLNTTTSNNSGECTTTYFIQDTSFHGLVYIKGYVNTNKGRIIGFNKILIQ